LAVVLMGAALLASPAAAASIQRFTDKEGTVHITNEGAEKKESPPSTASPASPLGAVRGHPRSFPPPSAQAPPPVPPPEEEPDQPINEPEEEADKGGARNKESSGANPQAQKGPEPTHPAVTGAGSASTTMKQVSWQGEDPALQAASHAKTSKKNSGRSEGSIRRYRDAQGVVHIENVIPEPAPGAGPAAILEAGDRSGGAPGPRLKEVQPWGLEGAKGGLPLKKVAWSGEEISPQEPRDAAVSKKAGAVVSGGIRRYRDEQGVLHIESVEPVRREKPLPPTRLSAVSIRDGPGPLPVPAQEIRPPPKGVETAGRPPPLNSSGSQVVAFKDSRGRLTIRNLDPEEKTGRAPPPGGASALLDPIILEAAQSNRLPVPLVQALIKVESNFVTWAVSPKGAMGLMQLMPGTASFLGVQDPFCPRQNILAGCRYLRLLLDCFNDNLPLALAAYNAGFQRVISAGFQVPQIKETQEFVTQVLGRYYASVKRARGSWI